MSPQNIAPAPAPAPAPTPALPEANKAGIGRQFIHIRSKGPEPERISSVAASKQWVLPPRPKPGRKAGQSTQSKTANGNGELKSALERSKRENDTLQMKIHQLEKKLNREMDSKAGSETYSSPDTAKSVSLATSTNGGPEFNCGFCDSEKNCVCADLEVKVAADSTDATAVSQTPVDFLAQYEHFTPLKAVPLIRSPQQKREWNSQSERRNHAKRFKKQNFDLEIDMNAYSLHAIKQRNDDNLISNYNDKDVNRGKVATTMDRLESTDRTPLTRPEQSSTELYALDTSTTGHVDSCGFCSSGTPCLCVDNGTNINTRSRSADGPSLHTIDTMGTIRHEITPSSSSSSSTSSSLTSSSSTSYSSFSSSSSPLQPLSSPQLLKSRKTSKLSYPDIATGDKERPQQSVTSTIAAPYSSGCCSQCQNDPMSTLFCTCLASRQQKLTRPGSLTVSCSKAYQVLSRHEQFAKIDLTCIISQLISENGQVDVDSISKTLRQMSETCK